MEERKTQETVTLRTATTADAAGIREVYAPYVRETAITFEYDVPSEAEMARRIGHTLERYPYIVAQAAEGRIVGYAYASEYYARAAYSRSVEVSIYVESGHHGQGLGRRLYARLEEELHARGFLNLTACIAWAEREDTRLTHQSALFHKQMGYTQCAHFHQIGYKFGRWFDIIWMEKMLGEHKDGAL